MSPAPKLDHSKHVQLARFQELAESLDQSLVLVVADLSQVLYVSPTYERMTGFSCDGLYESRALGWSQFTKKTGD